MPFWSFKKRGYPVSSSLRVESVAVIISYRCLLATWHPDRAPDWACSSPWKHFSQGTFSSSWKVCSVWLWSLPPMLRLHPGHLATSWKHNKHRMKIKVTTTLSKMETNKSVCFCHMSFDQIKWFSLFKCSSCFTHKLQHQPSPSIGLPLLDLSWGARPWDVRTHLGASNSRNKKATKES